MQPWEKMQEKHKEVERFSRELEDLFRKTGYPEQEASTLAWDLAELLGACRTYEARVLRLRKDLEEGMSDYIVELATLESYLEDLQGHLNDSLRSLPKYISFLPEQP